MPATQEATAELFDEIDPAYFEREGSFDATQYELDKMTGAEFEIDELERERFTLKRQLQVVSKKISALISANSLAFNDQVQEYSTISVEVKEVIAIVGGIRRALRKSCSELKVALRIVANRRQRQYLIQMTRAVRSLKDLYGVKFEIDAMIQRREYLPAIKKCMESIDHAGCYGRFTCMRGLAETRISTLKSLTSFVDSLLAASTLLFVPEQYHLVHSIYKVSDSLEGASMKLQSFFRTAIETACQEKARAFAASWSDPPNTTPAGVAEEENWDETDHVDKEEIFKAIPPDQICASLVELGRALCAILRNYHSILAFHIEDDARSLLADVSRSATPTNDTVDSSATDVVIEKGLLQSSMLNNLHSVLECAVSELNSFLCCADLSSLKFDQFLKVVEVSNRFRKFGRVHFGNPATLIAMTIEMQSINYFNRYHLERMDELKMFLEHETFTICPVSAEFTLFELPEFHFLKTFQPSPQHNCLSSHSPGYGNMAGEQLKFELLHDSNYIDPFVKEDPLRQKPVSEAGKSDASASSAPRTEAADEVTSCDLAPNLCNTALNLLRFFGRYLHMASLLPVMIERATESLIELNEYFFLMIYSFFCCDPSPSISQLEMKLSTLRLRSVIDSCKKKLLSSTNSTDIRDNDDPHEGGGSFPNCEKSPIRSRVRFSMAQLSSCIDLTEAESLFSLTERIVGVESAAYIGEQAELLRSQLYGMLPKGKKSQALDDFYRLLLPAVKDFHHAAFGNVASHILEHDGIIKAVVSENWDIREIHTQHSPHVDTILHDLSTFREKLTFIAQTVPLTSELNQAIWSAVLLQVFRTLVCAYANAEASKKCSSEGRALMLLNNEHLGRELEQLTGLHPLPHKAFLENYIRAFFLPRDSLDSWVVEHTEYNVSQVTALLNIHSSPRKKPSTKSILMNLILDNLDS